jgi:predicted acetyltransferase
MAMLNNMVLQDEVIELQLRDIDVAWFRVKAYLFNIVLIDSQEVVGHCDLRLLDNEENYYAGHIGYMVYMPYRGHNYAFRAGRLLLSLALSLKRRRLYITCSPENLVSYHIIEKLGGKYLRTVDVPVGHYLHQQNEPVKCIFEVRL